MIRYWLAGTAALAILSGVTPLQLVGAAYADDLPPIRCDASDKIDGSVAADAQKKMNAAGYQQVSGLKKGCDNFWHGMAIKDGVATHVSLSPQGLVQSEGD
jgi:hypothetical protein